ncbi:SMP-30/gluconolactonase/LRE family protein [Lysobacter sp. CFH 32150]|uniref:SMP-30/gluconolactonase/LRE family protein n=1 Tax=Lysobacter sp. CFH 32150 TaxID=2927128 RepID=UPI001FA7A343|nr:SMP-30/gluconolactonase/LRE family protein [Lysobacter sp. CFH 32150]MCI4566371.1 SMP-30/gluconolactonase/LRE family protein [Lysobacter sp. CFH 32150]
MTAYAAAKVEPELAVDSRCELGECVLWCERRSALFWTDITAARLWMHVPDGGVTRHWNLPERLGCFSLCDDGQLLLGLAKGLYLTDVDGVDALALKQVAEVERDRDDTRINDGRTDRHGNFVFGTKNERDDSATGGYYQFSFARGLRRLALPAAAIPNSICFSLDGGTMYFCDSRVPEILCCDYEADLASVSNVRGFAHVDAEGASPDGSIIDAEGFLWNVQWGAARVVRYRHDGSIERILAIPAKNPSCCTFGGANFAELYVTTAREDMTVDELVHMPHAGGIYRLPMADVRGLPEDRLVTTA